MAILKIKKIYKILKNFFIVLLFLLYFNIISIFAYSNEKYSISYVYEENNARMIYFDISDNKICIAYDNDQIYEFSKDGNFIRIINYESFKSIFAYYKEENLVIFDLLNDEHIVLNSNGDCIEKFESSKALSGYNIMDDFCENFSIEKNGYRYEYINANWFSRVFLENDSQIIVYKNGDKVFNIKENVSSLEDLTPLFLLSFFGVLITFVIVVKKKKTQD